MIIKENYGIEHIQMLQNNYKKDPSLLERVLYAFGLLEAITRVGMPYVFKGGTCLLLLTETPMRLSTDIDIFVEPGIDVEKYILEASHLFPFKYFEEQARIGKNKVEKRHFKFVYDSPLQKGEFYILLDIVFAEIPYEKILVKEINQEMLLVDHIPIYTKIPSAECLLGDKLTAFAPHTTGILFNKNKELEIIKQMFDVAGLINFITDYELIANTYERVVSEELAYRGLFLKKEDVLIDTINSAICIIGKGTIFKEEYPLFLRGIKSIGGHILGMKYSGEIAAQQACKVLYLASCLLTNSKYKPIIDAHLYANVSIATSKYNKLAYIRKQSLEAYGYLVEAVHLLDE